MTKSVNNPDENPELIKDNTTKHLSFDFDVKEINEDDDFYYFKGYGSTFGNLDLVGDVVMPGAFLKSLAKKKPVMLWQHNRNEPIGVFDVIYEDTKGLYVEGKMPKSDTFVSGRVYPQLKAGSVPAMSIGYSISDYEMIDGVCYLKELNLYEISLVTFPANPKATVDAVKNIDEISSERDAEKFLKGFLSAEKSKHLISRLKTIFIQRDVEEKEEKQKRDVFVSLTQEIQKLNSILNSKGENKHG